ncbi:maltose permease Mal61 [Penicillium hetheringtonii]|uniref:Maltose permease Mal61 n=1 Tax=Penicillium hetheringtonii TaxID=911720 RepID=A0AAD6GQZ4_9EURO|nr:maltose permease Mal61 [Penicillium hetheringtonii]
MPGFAMQFGELANGSYVIPAYWQSLWNAMAQIATMLGATTAGPVQDFLGRRASFLLGAIVSAVGVAVVYTSTSPGVFLAGKIVNGLSMGICLTTGQTYISEVTPLPLRGIALSFFTFCMNLGYMIAASVALPRMSIVSENAYRVLFAAAWVWPGVIVLFLPVLPESPYFLVMKNRLEKARKSLARLGNKQSEITGLLNQIIRVNEEEKARSAVSKEATFIECFRGTNWRRTRIILFCNALQQVIGSSFMSNGPYFMVQAGMSAAKTGMMTEIGIGFGIASSILTAYLMTQVGRRRLILFGISLSVTFFTVMGIAGCFPQSSQALWVVGIFLQLSWWVYGPAIGPAMAIAGEVSAVRLRAKSMAIGFTFNYFFSTVWNVVIPYLYNTDEADLGGKIGWIFAGMGVIALVVIYFEIPETKGRSFEELDEMFNEKISTRAFRRYQCAVPQQFQKLGNDA